MNILLIGSGGREHALAWAISNSPLLSKLYCAPGNGGISDIAQCVHLDPGDHGAVSAFCKDNDVSFVVIGPEAPLVAGLGEALRNHGLDVFGPNTAAAQLEGSKAYTKELCAEYNIPTAAFARFTDAPAAKAYVRSHGAPIVIKADGLAAGKGVVMAETVAEAEAAIDACLAGEFGDGGTELIVEDLMIGEEASFFALVDGQFALPLATAQDHKRAHDGDTGPNTGGMGAYSPAPVMTDELCTQTMDEIIMPTVRAMADRGTPFQGVLYAGLMITGTGPKLIEYNIRFGDPECQVLMMRLKSDIVPALLATSTGELSGIDLQWHDDTALTVVMAANGYPGAYEKGTPIAGLSQAAENSGCTVYHAGTARNGDALTAIGGRVLNVTARARTVSAARKKAYDCVSQINWPDGFYRHDIGHRAIAREHTD